MSSIPGAASSRRKVTVQTILEQYRRGEPITVVTAYDYPSAVAVEEAGLEVILVGDSLGMVVLGHESTLPVTMDDMLRHAQAVRRGAVHPLLNRDPQRRNHRLAGVDRHVASARLLRLFVILAAFVFVITIALGSPLALKQIGLGLEDERRRRQVIDRRFDIFLKRRRQRHGQAIERPFEQQTPHFKGEIAAAMDHRNQRDPRAEL